MQRSQASSNDELFGVKGSDAGLTAAGEPHREVWPPAAEATVHELFELQAARSPEAVAVSFGDRSLSYAELDRRADRLADSLRSWGVGPEVAVGSCLERSVELVVAMVAILKAGGAYLPLDLGYPSERLRLMVEDSGALLVLASPATRETLGPLAAPVVLMDGELPLDAGRSSRPAATRAGADNLALILYTSGSSGRPKGVGLAHRGVRRLVVDAGYIEFMVSDRVAQVANLSFDAATFEIWGALLNGACLVGLERSLILSPAVLSETLERHRIT
ncbi:MAG: AMP-binding protein, partial [Thermoanaerobaculia bacterium]